MHPFHWFGLGEFSPSKVWRPRKRTWEPYRDGNWVIWNGICHVYIVYIIFLDHILLKLFYGTLANTISATVFDFYFTDNLIIYWIFRLCQAHRGSTIEPSNSNIFGHQTCFFFEFFPSCWNKTLLIERLCVKLLHDVHWLIIRLFFHHCMDRSRDYIIRPLPTIIMTIMNLLDHTHRFEIYDLFLPRPQILYVIYYLGIKSTILYILRYSIYHHHESSQCQSPWF